VSARGLRRLTSASLLALAAASPVAAAPATPAAPAVRGWRDVVKPPLPSFQAPAPVRIAFPNGLIVFLQEDHELPLVSGSIWIRGGSR